MKKHIEKHLVIILYIAVFALILLNGMFNFVLDIIFMPSPQVLTVSDFTLHQLELTGDNTLISTGNDPQLILNSNGQKLRTISYSLKEDANGEICAYYAKSGEDFSNFNRLFPSFGQYSEAFYVFPQNNVDTIRIDLGTIIGANFEFESIVLNENIPFLTYFKLQSRTFIVLLLLPILICGLWQFIKEISQNKPAIKDENFEK